MAFHGRDMDTGEVFLSLSRRTKPWSSIGPIVTPFDKGVNITWWTEFEHVARLCVDDVLYVGDGELENTIALQGCDSATPVVIKPNTKH